MLFPFRLHNVMFWWVLQVLLANSASHINTMVEYQVEVLPRIEGKSMKFEGKQQKNAMPLYLSIS